ncbi:MAG: GNAT family N-acetyltransferase [Erysipelothrix sp.]|nr:GNAT family N-acetyltransferase [Erysipelothrix sp.]
MIRISSVENIDSKEKIVRSILKDLPEYFGIEENIKDYTDNAKGYPLWVAFDGALAVGFISLKKTSEFTAEIYCMGIKEEYHGKNIGTKLYQAFNAYTKSKYLYEQVKTVAFGRYDNYDKTVRFYKKMGFKELEVFPYLWDAHNPCLIMIKNV